MPATEDTAAPVTVRLLEPSANLGLTELSVTPGLVDAHARELFLYAQCQMLALALHEQTGWPLWVAEQHLRSGAWAWAHVAVRNPRGKWLDIEGPRDSQQVTAWLSQWGLPVRLRLLDEAAEWHTMLGRAASTPASWWRTQVVGGNTGIALVESFARALLASSKPPDGTR
jgi:hypothetical protein